VSASARSADGACAALPLPRYRGGKRRPAAVSPSSEHRNNNKKQHSLEKISPENIDGGMV
ncbi:MAG: hypothetical protein UDK32_10235, partial [Adlercreutzia sp.]|nr:hypothetical protein [Adlercreutzia sp.]